MIDPGVYYPDKFQEFSSARYRNLAIPLVYLPAEIVLLVGHFQTNASSVTYVFCSRPGKCYKISLSEQVGLWYMGRRGEFPVRSCAIDYAEL